MAEERVTSKGSRTAGEKFRTVLCGQQIEGLNIKRIYLNDCVTSWGEMERKYYESDKMVHDRIVDNFLDDCPV